MAGTKHHMEFVHRPAGVPDDKHKRWPFEPGKMSNREAEAIEDVSGWTFVHWQTMFFSGSMRAIHALLWTYLRRELPNLAYDEVEFTDDETWFGIVDEHGNPVKIDDDGNVIGSERDDQDDAGAEGKAPEGDPETTTEP